jgi:hypothetical protein
MNEPSGRRWRDPFARFDPDTSSWKTWQPSLPLENLPELPVTWPRSGTWDLGAAYALPTSVPPTDVCGPSSLLPTPNAADGMGGPGNSGRDGGLNLRTAATLLPTPMAAEIGSQRDLTRHRAQMELSDIVRLLPTPSVADATGGHRSRSGDRSSELLLPGIAQSIGEFMPSPLNDGNNF